MRQRAGGTAYLDAAWPEHGLVVEIDGAQHFEAAAIVPDLLRHNDIALDGDMVLRIPVLGLRVAAAEFMAQVAQGLRRGGWAGALQPPARTVRPM
jgi:very-short-patch-repair endonuclease